MQVFTPVEVAKHATNKYLAVVVAAKFARVVNEFPRDPCGGFNGFITCTARHRCRIENQDRVNVRTVIEFTAAMFAQSNRGKPAWFFSGKDGGECGGYGLIEGIIGKVGKLPDYIVERECSRQVTMRKP